jgi:predicted transcriptional regulator
MNAKERVVRLVKKIPDDASREEVLRRLRLFYQVELGMRDIEEGNFVDHDEFFDELLSDEEEGFHSLVKNVDKRSARGKENHRPRQAKGRSEVRERPKKVRGQT